jgi:hypothetical protein
MIRHLVMVLRKQNLVFDTLKFFGAHPCAISVLPRFLRGD